MKSFCAFYHLDFSLPLVFLVHRCDYIVNANLFNDNRTSLKLLLGHRGLYFGFQCELILMKKLRRFCRYGSVKMVKMLIDAGADVNKPNSKTEEFPLDLAVHFRGKDLLMYSLYFATFTAFTYWLKLVNVNCMVCKTSLDW